MNDQHCNGEQLGSSMQNLFILGDAASNMGRLLDSYAGSAQVVYLDPPFMTGGKFSCRVQLDAKKTGTISLPAYSDELVGEPYYTMMEFILRGCHKLLSDQGSLFLHVDTRATARLKLMLDSIFGEENFVNEIIWHYKSGGRAKTHFSRKHDNILFYKKTKNAYFNIDAVGVPRGPDMQNHMKRSVDDKGRVVYTISSGGKTYTYSEDTPVFPSDVWTDISHLQQKDPERTGYDTQKPEALLKRILLASSRPGDLVIDLFSGSGTTAITAHKLDRRFVVMDKSPLAMALLRRRLLSRETTFIEQAAPGTCLLFDVTKPPALGELTFECTRANGRADIKLKSYEPPEGYEIPSGLSPLALLDYCAVGFVKDGYFTAGYQSIRSSKGGSVDATYLAPDREGLTILACDVFGCQGLLSV